VKRELPFVALLLILCNAGIMTAVSTISQAREQSGETTRKTPATGPLRVSMANPRYFSDESGRPIYLAGSYSDWSLQDNAWGGGGGVFDLEAFLDLSATHNHNFQRMSAVETSRTRDKQRALTTPMVYERTGPGHAIDGAPKFNLTQFNPVYFDRLRSRVVAARDRGIYVMVMLFQGWSLESKDNPSMNPWPGHPYHRANNINGINGDRNGNRHGEEIHTLTIPAVTRLQEAYVRKVVDTLNDLDNVLYEIANESHNQSIGWQYHMIRYIHKYETGKPKQHPVVMTVAYPEGDNAVLFKSPAEAISPNPNGGYKDNPPAADGNKIIIADTDHLLGSHVDHMWVWKSFLRGLNPIFLDPRLDPDKKPDALHWQLARRNLGYTRRFAQRINLATMVPRNDLSSSAYCLAHPGVAYLAYLPAGGTASVDLRAAEGTMTVEWFSPSTGETMDGGRVKGGAITEFVSPFTSRFTLHWVRRNIDRVLRTLGVEKPVQLSDAVLYLTADKVKPRP